MPDFPTLEGFLEGPNIAVLATIDRRNRPHAAPVWYQYQDGDFIISTFEGSQKRRNIAANPNVTLVIDRRTPPYYAVIVRGTAEIGAPLTPAELLRLAVRYYGEKVGNEYASAPRAPEENQLTIRINPSRITDYRGETGRASD